MKSVLDQCKSVRLNAAMELSELRSIAAWLSSPEAADEDCDAESIVEFWPEMEGFGKFIYHRRNKKKNQTWRNVHGVQQKVCFDDISNVGGAGGLNTSCQRSKDGPRTSL